MSWNLALLREEVLFQGAPCQGQGNSDRAPQGWEQCRGTTQG